MDDNLIYVIMAFLITGLAIGAYLVTLGRQAQNVREEYEALTGESSSRQNEPRVTPSSRPTTTGKTRA